MNIKSMYEAKEMLCKELEDITREGNISANDLEPIEQLTTSIKNLMKISEMEEQGSSYGRSGYSGGMSGYSGGGMSGYSGNMNSGYSGRMNSGYSGGMNSGYSGRGSRSSGVYGSNTNDYYEDMESRMRREMNY